MDLGDDRSPESHAHNNCSSRRRKDAALMTPMNFRVELEPTATREQLAAELRSCEQALRASEARFERMASALSQFIWESDASGRLVYVNQRWKDYSGFTSEQATDTEQVAALVHPDDRETVERAWFAALKQAAALNVEARIRRHDGIYRSF